MTLVTVVGGPASWASQVPIFTKPYFEIDR